VGFIDTVSGLKCKKRKVVKKKGRLEFRICGGNFDSVVWELYIILIV